MRIYASFEPWESGRHAFLDAHIRADDLGLSGALSFMIDTGAARTFLSWNDAGRLGMPYKTYNLGKEKLLGIGTGAKTHVVPCDIKLSFKTASNRLFSVTKKDTRILQNPDNSPIPSILGNDFLTEYGFRLFYDLHKNLVYLER